MARAIIEIDGCIFSDPVRFRQDICEPGRPVAARGVASDWPSVRAALDSPDALHAYLARFAGDARVETFVGNPEIRGRYSYTAGLDGFNFDRVEYPLDAALEHIFASSAEPDGTSLYIGSLDADRFLPGFSGENRVDAVPGGVAPGIWAGNRSHISCHNDTYDNIACVVAGRRRFTLYPPEAVSDLYIGPIDNTMAGRPVSLAADSPGPDPRFPRFEAVRDQASTCELNPGDAIYIPKLWWHQVEATASLNVLANYWWDAFSFGPDAPYTTMMLAMIAIAERPDAERAAWRALFDHYVFRPDGHPLAHLAAQQRGILGPVRDNYGRIRAMVMQLLRGG